MKVLVTGGSGFIGSHLIEALAHRKYSSILFDRASHWPHQKKKCTFFLGDIRNKDAVFEAVNQCDCWINLAGLLGTSELISNPFPAIDANISGALNVYEAAHVHKKPGVQITVGNYWMNNPYSITKSTAERFALMYNKELGTRIAVVRGMNVYGPGQKHRPVRKMIPNFIIPALLGEPLVVYGDGSQIMDVIYVDDIVDILILFLELVSSDFDGDLIKVFEAGAGAITVIEVVNKILEITESRSPVHMLPMRAGEDKKAIVQISEQGFKDLEKYIGYVREYLTPLEVGLKETVAWYKEHLEEFPWSG